MSDDGLQAPSIEYVLLQEMSALLQPVAALASPAGVAATLRDLGWDFPTSSDFPAAFDFTDDLQDIQETLSLALAAPDEVEQVLQYVSLSTKIQALIATLRTVPELMEKALGSFADFRDRSGVEADLFPRLVDYLTVRYLHRNHQFIHDVALIVGLVRYVEVPAKPARYRLATRVRRVEWQRLPEVLTNPGSVMGSVYAWQTDFDVENFLGRLLLVTRHLGFFGTMHEQDARVRLALGRAPGDVLELRMPFLQSGTWPGSYTEGGLRFSALPETGSEKSGLAILPYLLGRSSATAEILPGVQVEMSSSVAMENGIAIFVRPDSDIDVLFNLVAAPEVPDSVRIELHCDVSPPDGEGRAVLGASDRSNLSFKGADGGVVVDKRGSAVTLAVEAGVEQASIVIAPGEGDGFLQRILPADGLRTNFNLGLGWSSRNGLYFRGSAGLEADLRVDADLFGLLTMDSMHLALRADGAGVRGEVSTTVTVHIGPVTATVERFGLDALVTFPPSGGNLGVADLDLRFKPPSGAALTIDAGVVVGGGYLFFDPEKEQYAGAVQLELAETLNLTAFGLLTTRMPDGSPGFSLLVLIAATFSPPVQLGYGFTLSGVGGLIGVNRTIAIEPLRAGLRTGALGSVLFPVDPIRNAPQIVSDLAAIFPPAPGRFLVGPMVQLGWGTPTVLTIELGLILELPAPVRLLILGRLKVVLPDEKAPVVRLQLDAVGIVDFATGDVALDAVLYDSRIAAFTITGAMALRANFGEKPGMVLAIGGFNPRFQAPTGFPALDRVAINLAAGDNPRLRLEAYFALTTNTVQFGALLDLFAKAGPFSIAGMMSLDVLLQLAPFGFIADLGASLALKYNGKSVMSVGLQMTLTGPTPWHAWGKASYEVLFFSGSIDFDVRIGPAQAPALPPPVNIRPLLVAALREPGNWSTELPRGEHPIVSLRDQLGTTERLVHPLADLRVTQRVAPLGREISRFGATAPERERVFNLGVVGADGKVRTTPDEGVQTVTEHFAPAQFRQMSDDEKLTAPAFESMQAGLRFASQGYDCGPPVVEPEIVYARETIHRADQVPAGTAVRRATASSLSRKPSSLVAGEDVVVTADFVRNVANAGSTAAFAGTGDRRFEAHVAPAVALRRPRFAVVVGRGLDAMVAPIPKPDTSPGPKPGVDETRGYTDAFEALQSRLEARPGDRGRLHVVPVYEGETG